MKFQLESLEAAIKQFVSGADPDPRKERKRQAILQAATELFIDQGYRKTSVDEVARRAGVSKGTVYLYFKNKGDLLFQAIAREKLQYTEVIKGLFSPGLDSRERLHHYLLTAARLLPQMPLTSRAVRGDPDYKLALDELGIDLNRRVRAMQLAFAVGLITPIGVSHRWSPTEIRDKARVFLALLYQLSNLLGELDEQGMDAERAATLIADILTDGFAPRRS